ncbi:hypothetical protein JCM15519_09920 [Fundidesulfovibrio butyratiphilus]
MDFLDTPYGRLGPLAFVERDASDGVTSVTASGPFTVHTPLGPLTPQHTTDDMRRPKVEPLTFHRGGAIRTIALENRTKVSTPLGPMEAELLTFHPDGSLHRLFPLNGKLSGYWTVEEETSLAGPVSLITPAGPVTAKLVGIRFSPAGRLIGLTLWPGEIVEINTPVGRRKARMGMTFHEDGALASYEPAEPSETPTPIGAMMAFDPEASGVHGDTNSLTFAPNGSLLALTTTMHTVAVILADGSKQLFAPAMIPNLCDETVLEPKGIRLRFPPGAVLVDEAGPFDLADHTFELGRPQAGGFELGALPLMHCG